MLDVICYQQKAKNRMNLTTGITPRLSYCVSSRVFRPTWYYNGLWNEANAFITHSTAAEKYILVEVDFWKKTKKTINKLKF